MPKSNSEVRLEQVIGTTACDNSQIAWNPVQPQIAYPAGCVAVLYNVRFGKQEKLIIACKSKISSLTYSKGGKYLSVGGSGSSSSVTVWDIQNGHRVCKLLGHKSSVTNLVFSPDGKYLLSTSSEENKLENARIILWDWQAGKEVFSHEPRKQALCGAFSPDGSFFVCGGEGWIKTWSLEMTHLSEDNVSPQEENVDLRRHHDKTYVSLQIASGNNPAMYCVTSSGILCQIVKSTLTVPENPEEPKMLWRMDKWVDLKLKGAGFAVSLTDLYICIAGRQSKIRLFQPETLQHAGNFPSPEHRGKPPDALGCHLSKDSKRAVTLYSDRSIVIWNTSNPKAISSVRLLSSHGGPITNIVYHQNENALNTPSDYLISSSTDGTIRAWDVSPDNEIVGENFLTCGLSEFGGGVKSLQMVSDEIMACGDEKGAIHLIRIDDFKVICSSSEEGCGIREISVGTFPSEISKRKKILRVAAGYENGTVKLFEVSPSKDLSLLDKTDSTNGNPLAGAILLPTGSRIVTFATNGQMKVYNISSEGKLSEVLKGDTKCQVTDIDLHPNHRYIIACGNDRCLHIFSVDTGLETKKYAAHQKKKIGVRYSSIDPSALFVVASCTDNSLRLIDWLSGSLIAKMTGHAAPVPSVQFSPDCAFMYSCSHDGCIFIHRVSEALSKPMLERMDDSTRKSMVFEGSNPTDDLILDDDEKTLPIASASPPGKTLEISNNLMTPTTPDTSPGRVKLLRHQSADTSQEFPSTPHKGGKKGGGDGKETPSAVRKKRRNILDLLNKKRKNGFGIPPSTPEFSERSRGSLKVGKLKDGIGKLKDGIDDNQNDPEIKEEIETSEPYSNPLTELTKPSEPKNEAVKPTESNIKTIKPSKLKDETVPSSESTTNPDQEPSGDKEHKDKSEFEDLGLGFQGKKTRVEAKDTTVVLNPSKGGGGAESTLKQKIKHDHMNLPTWLQKSPQATISVVSSVATDTIMDRMNQDKTTLPSWARSEPGSSTIKEKPAIDKDKGDEKPQKKGDEKPQKKKWGQISKLSALRNVQSPSESKGPSEPKEAMETSESKQPNNNNNSGPKIQVDGCELEETKGQELADDLSYTKILKDVNAPIALKASVLNSKEEELRNKLAGMGVQLSPNKVATVTPQEKTDTKSIVVAPTSPPAPAESKKLGLEEPRETLEPREPSEHSELAEPLEHREPSEYREPSEPRESSEPRKDAEAKGPGTFMTELRVPETPKTIDRKEELIVDISPVIPRTTAYTRNQIELIHKNPVQHVRQLADQLRQSLKILMPMVSASRSSMMVGRRGFAGGESVEGTPEPKMRSPVASAESLEGMAIENELGGMLEVLENTLGPETAARRSRRTPLGMQSVEDSTISLPAQEIVRSVNSVMEKAMDRALENYSSKLVKMLSASVSASKDLGKLTSSENS
ncbi:hypothetical protein AAMO2058_000428600 [Amorphochlora amoebiformis]